MATATVEERLTELERTVARLAEEKEQSSKQEGPWWEAISGTFADSPDYDEAMRLGRAYRESLRPSEEDSDSGTQ